MPKLQKVPGYDTYADVVRFAGVYCRIERLDYEDGKLVAVTLEPEGEVWDE